VVGSRATFQLKNPRPKRTAPTHALRLNDGHSREACGRGEMEEWTPPHHVHEAPADHDPEAVRVEMGTIRGVMNTSISFWDFSRSVLLNSTPSNGMLPSRGILRSDSDSVVA
jgi:hypothetical protein